MTTDITELAQNHELRNKVNHRLYAALEFQGTSGEHATITLSIDECKSIIAAMDERLALVEALEKAQQRITQLESRAVKLPPCVDDLHGIGMVMSADAVVEALTSYGIKVEAE
ncbi:hypothetical protein [Klebsiella pneumoniae]|uniref:hypothetical protein n=1 Tax=Klebsiella pneumoniae TaxID=573 RepID=UPI000D396743|nr:hypothetical protein [Klebsiella pneumoniae]PUH07968.1 hypothetical protein DB361_12685 [Klebsiella pneumoniae]